MSGANAHSAQRDHVAFARALTPDQRRQFNRLTNRHGLIRLAAHGGLIVFAAIAASWMLVLSWWLALVPLLVQGVLLVFLFTPLHESIHRTAFKSARLNRLSALFCGFVVGLSPSYFRAFHFAHHRHTHDPEHDPELAVPKPNERSRLLWYLTGLPENWSRIVTLFRLAVRGSSEDFVPPRATARIKLEARLFLASYVLLIVTMPSTVLLFWIVPALLGQPALRLYLLAEHGRCPHVANMFENTRTTFTNRLVRFVAWNMPYHAEHHAVPTVPFHQLPNLHRLSRKNLKSTADGYARFGVDYVQSTPLKSH